MSALYHSRSLSPTPTPMRRDGQMYHLIPPLHEKRSGTSAEAFALRLALDRCIGRVDVLERENTALLQRIESIEAALHRRPNATLDVGTSRQYPVVELASSTEAPQLRRLRHDVLRCIQEIEHLIDDQADLRELVLHGRQSSPARATQQQQQQQQHLHTPEGPTLSNINQSFVLDTPLRPPHRRALDVVVARDALATLHSPAVQRSNGDDSRRSSVQRRGVLLSPPLQTSSASSSSSSPAKRDSPSVSKRHETLGPCDSRRRRDHQAAAQHGHPSSSSSAPPSPPQSISPLPRVDIQPQQSRLLFGAGAKDWEAWQHLSVVTATMLELQAAVQQLQLGGSQR